MADSNYHVKNPDYILHSIKPGDIIETSANVLQNPKYIKVSKYIAIDQDSPKLKVVHNDGENVLGVIDEHIVVKYKFKEVIDLFIKFLFGIPKINNIKVRVIKTLWQRS